MPEETRSIPTAQLKIEAGADEMVRSEGMRPYLDLLKLQIAGDDTDAALAAIARLSLERRYVWRVISALKWGLCGLDTENVAADVRTLSPRDRNAVAEPLRLRAMQLSLFMKALVGEDAARAILLQALACLKA